MQLTVHCAEMGNPAKPAVSSVHRAARITSDFLRMLCHGCARCPVMSCALIIVHWDFVHKFLP